MPQARAALMGGSFALGAARKLNNIRKAISGSGGGDNKGRRRLSTTAPAALGLSPAAAPLAAQRPSVTSGSPVWAAAVGEACGGRA